jgi:hypothetical protein
MAYHLLEGEQLFLGHSNETRFQIRRQHTQRLQQSRARASEHHRSATSTMRRQSQAGGRAAAYVNALERPNDTTPQQRVPRGLAPAPPCRTVA